MTNTTHFGFKEVGEDEKSSLVRGVFDSVASRYDLMNDVMSGGLHRVWKNELVAMLNPKPDMRILDVAGGTGDIAFRILDSLPHRGEARRIRRGVGANLRDGTNSAPLPTSPLRGEEIDVTILDINERMLEEGKNRALDRNLLHGLEWICADAEALPFPDNHFDAYTIAFGIRNVTHLDRALAEAYRVLRHGGRFLCLEFSAVKNDLLKTLYDAYSFSVIPKVGKWITGDAAAYQYLVESIRRFPAQEAFAEKIRAAGFGQVQCRSLTGGVVAIHSGRKL